MFYLVNYLHKDDIGLITQSSFKKDEHKILRKLVPSNNSKGEEIRLNVTLELLTNNNKLSLYDIFKLDHIFSDSTKVNENIKIVNRILNNQDMQVLDILENGLILS